MRFGLSEQTIEKICSVFAKHPAIDKAVLYGSRAKGTFRPGSDIDLSLHGPGISSRELGRIDTEIDDLLLPYSVDLLIFDALDHAKLRDHIERVGVIFYQRNGAGQYQGTAAMKGAWICQKLGDVCSFLNRGISPKYLDQGGVCVLNQKCIRDHSVNYGLSRRHSIEAKAVAKERFIQVGDVLVNSTGTGTLGRVAQVRNEPSEPTTVDSHVTIVRPKPGLFHVDFFGYMLAVIEDAIKEAGEGCGGQTELARSTLSDRFSVTYPPSLPEQQRIVTILDQAFAGIATAKANAEKNLQNARDLFDSHLQSVFSQRGKGWAEKRLDEVCTFRSGGTPSKSNSSYWNGNIPWVSGRDMKSTKLFDSVLHISKSAVDESSTRMAPTGALLILVRGMGLAHGAQIAELMVPCAFNQDIRAIQPNRDLIPRYLLFALRDRINSSDTVLSNAAHGTLKIDSNELQKVMIPCSSREHQQKIVTKIDSLTEATQRLESIYRQKLTALENLKKSLLYQAFSGQL